MNLQPNSEVRAWHNVMGFAPMPWRGDSAIIATHFSPEHTKFGNLDLDGDGKAEIIYIDPEVLSVRAWHNVMGFAPMPWRGDSVIIATGFSQGNTFLI